MSSPIQPHYSYAPAKINLCLFVGPSQADGRHQLVTVFDSLSLADTVTLHPAPPGTNHDCVLCPGVQGENLALQALKQFRATFAWDVSPLEIVINKQIPIAGGMAGGSADAAAVLRIAAKLYGGVNEKALLKLAASLGSDVPSQVLTGPVLGTAGGEVVQRLSSLGSYTAVVIRTPYQLSAGEVFAKADELGIQRASTELAELCQQVLATVQQGTALTQKHLLVNDLQPAALALCPELEVIMEQVKQSGAERVFVSGSGPSIIGLFYTSAHKEHAETAAERLRSEHSLQVNVCTPVEQSFSEVQSANIVD